jgi:hypothetical protein
VKRIDGVPKVWVDLLLRVVQRVLTPLQGCRSTVHAIPVLEESFHLSYPFVFAHAGNV